MIACEQLKFAVDKNAVVFQERQCYAGWPANHGIWSWGDEIVVGFAVAKYQRFEDPRTPSFIRPLKIMQARSIDGGEKWTLEEHSCLQSPETGGPTPGKLCEPVDFEHPDFALMFKFVDHNIGPSRFYVSTDRCRSWAGPYAFSVSGLDRIVARTDYIVLGPQRCIAFASSDKGNNLEGHALCAETVDGGQSWHMLSHIGAEPLGYSIMPSTVRLGDGRLFTTVRQKNPLEEGSIHQYTSEDDGRTWKSMGAAVDRFNEGNPPSLVRMRDGRLCLTYGYRAAPFGVRARVSADEGASWSEDLVLRDDGLAFDLGYVRSVQRSDGKMVTVHYFNGPNHEDRSLQATIWTL